MEIEKFNGHTDFMTDEKVFARLMKVIDLIDKNIKLNRSLLAGMEDRFENRGNADLWEKNSKISTAKRCWKEAIDNDWNQTIINIKEHFDSALERGWVNYRPELMLEKTFEVDYDLQRVIAACPEEDLPKYIDKIRKIQVENFQAIEEELNPTDEDSLESYWNQENYQIFTKALDNTMSNISFCRNSLKDFIEIYQEEKSNDAARIVNEIAELEQERMNIDNKISEKIKELNNLVSKTNKNVSTEENENLETDTEEIQEEFNI